MIGGRFTCAFMTFLTMVTWGHYITMLPADWSIYLHAMTLCPPVSVVKNAMEPIYRYFWLISPISDTNLIIGESQKLAAILWHILQCAAWITTLTLGNVWQCNTSNMETEDAWTGVVAHSLVKLQLTLSCAAHTNLCGHWTSYYVGLGSCIVCKLPVHHELHITSMKLPHVLGIA